MKIAKGSHNGSLVENCVMEHVALEYLQAQGIVSTSDLLRLKTDRPGCTARWITDAAQTVNDTLDDAGRQRLELLIPRLLHDARMPADPDKAHRVAVRVSCWAARSVLDAITDEHDHETAIRSIQTAEAWLRGEVTKEECRAAASAGYAASYAASAAASAARAAASAGYASYAASAAASAAAERDLVLWLDELLDAHIKALAEEGLLGAEDAFEVWAVEACPA